MITLIMLPMFIQFEPYAYTRSLVLTHRSRNSCLIYISIFFILFLSLSLSFCHMLSHTLTLYLSLSVILFFRLCFVSLSEIWVQLLIHYVYGIDDGAVATPSATNTLHYITLPWMQDKCIACRYSHPIYICASPFFPSFYYLHLQSDLFNWIVYHSHSILFLPYPLCPRSTEIRILIFNLFASTFPIPHITGLI